jgi:hypothetical protein
LEIKGFRALYALIKTALHTFATRGDKFTKKIVTDETLKTTEQAKK